MPDAYPADRPLLRLVERFLASCDLLKQGAPLLVGVSGGPDSVCLLHLLARIAPHFPLQLHVAHLDHGLRGAEGEADVEFVRQLCHTLGVPCWAERREVGEYQRDNPHVSSVEEAAREVRYAFFLDVAQQVGATAVAVGHTADDQVETVLLHLLRGSGIAGLGGMDSEGSWLDRRSETRLGILRPLLQVRKTDTERYCRLHGLQARADSLNRPLRFTRNCIRRRLLPEARQINPNVDQAILRLAKMAREEEAFWESEAARSWTLIARVDRAGVRLDRRGMLALPLPLQQRLVRKAYAHVTRHLRGFEHAHIEATLSLLRGGAGKRLNVGHHVEVEALHDSLVVKKAEPQGAGPADHAPTALQVPRTTHWGGWEVRSRLHAGSVLPDAMTPWRAHLDYARTGAKLFLRSRRPGDRFQPLGMSGTKKLQDMLVDAHVPRQMRDGVPLLEASGQIAWVGGQRVGEAFKVSSTTHTTLEVEFFPTTDLTRTLLRSCDKVHYNGYGAS